MGYYTRYKVEILNGEIDEKEFSDVFEKVTGYPYDMLEDDIKWYDCKKDMKIISRDYPSVIFEVSGEGEEAGDLWKWYIKNGEMQVARAKITYDLLDPDKFGQDPNKTYI